MVVMGRFFSGILAFFLLFIVTVPVTYAAHGRVLSAVRNSSRVDLTVNQGPGFLLPSSPIYFVDLLRDNLTLFLVSYDGSIKAKEHLRIAGERVAELNVLLDKEVIDQKSLNVGLENLADHVQAAAETLRSEKHRGKNVEELASDLNKAINEQKQSLRAIRVKGDNEANLKITAKLATIRDIEVTVEDEMRKDLLENEIVSELKIAYEEEAKAAAKAAERVASFGEEVAKLASPSGAVAGTSENKSQEESELQVDQN